MVRFQLEFERFFSLSKKLLVDMLRISTEGVKIVKINTIDGNMAFYRLENWIQCQY